MKRRKLDGVGTDNVIDEGLRELAAEYYIQNKIKNEANGRAEKARTGLFAAMCAKAVRAFRFPMVNGDGKSVDLNVEIGPGRPSFRVDMKALRKLVSDDEKL